ncbi:VCBS repeat-containing protein, partial [bacterium]|nr:VCBS repeat-containing protein [bacterium]
LKKRVAVGKVENALKGKREFQTIQMNIGIGPGDHAKYMLARLKPGEPFIIYYKLEGRNLASCVHAGDTWFQLFGTDEKDRKRVWWRLTHIEVYMGRTFNGSTPELVKLTSDVIAGRTRAPKPNPRVAKLDPRRSGPVVAARPVQDDIDGLEALPGWYADDSWARPAKVVARDSKTRGKVLDVACNGSADKKLAVTLLHHFDLSRASQLAMTVDNPGPKAARVSIAFGIAPDWPMYETPAVTVPAKSKAAPISFALDGKTFKSAASGWKHTQPAPNGGRVDKVMLLVEGLPATASVAFDRIRGARGGFHRRVVIAHAGGEPRGMSWADVNGDERLDLFICGTNGNVLALNEGDTFASRAAALGISGSSRAAAWADYNADGHPDLVTTNFQLFTNVGGRFRDDSAVLPGRKNPEGGGWIDYDGDGRPDILLTNGEAGIALFRNTGDGFGNVTATAGLGKVGRGNGDFIAFADYDGDGYTDFFYNLGRGVLAHNEGDGTFTLDSKSGIQLSASGYKCGVSFADMDNDGDLDLFVPASGKPRLYRNNNDGTFADVIGSSGDLAGYSQPSFAAAWGDVNHDGALDLFVCHTRGPGRLYLGDGKGKFKDASAASGLDDLTPATGASFADADGDGDLDLVANLADRAVVAYNDMDKAADRTWLLVRPNVKRGLVGAVVRVSDAKGRPLGLRELNGAESAGGQASPMAHFGVPLGSCRVSVALSDGRVAQKTVAVAAPGARVTLADGDFK